MKTTQITTLAAGTLALAALSACQHHAQREPASTPASYDPLAHDRTQPWPALPPPSADTQRANPRVEGEFGREDMAPLGGSSAGIVGPQPAPNDAAGATPAQPQPYTSTQTLSANPFDSGPDATLPEGARGSQPGGRGATEPNQGATPPNDHSTRPLSPEGNPQGTYGIPGGGQRSMPAVQPGPTGLEESPAPSTPNRAPSDASGAFSNPDRSLIHEGDQQQP